MGKWYAEKTPQKAVYAMVTPEIRDMLDQYIEQRRKEDRPITISEVVAIGVQMAVQLNCSELHPVNVNGTMSYVPLPAAEMVQGMMDAEDRKRQEKNNISQK